MKATKEQIKATIETVRVIADAVRQLGSVPNGILYAQVMPHMSFELYERVIETLKRTGLVEEKFHVLHWRGPALEQPQDAALVERHTAKVEGANV